VLGLHTVSVGHAGLRTLNASPLLAVLIHVFRCSKYGPTIANLSYCANKIIIPNQYNSAACCNSPVLPAVTTETITFTVVRHEYQGCF